VSEMSPYLYVFMDTVKRCTSIIVYSSQRLKKMHQNDFITRSFFMWWNMVELGTPGYADCFSMNLSGECSVPTWSHSVRAHRDSLCFIGFESWLLQSPGGCVLW
jgi:hypothetical protein